MADMPSGGSYTLRDLTGRRETVAWHCTRCDRSGDVSVAELVDRFGLDARMPDLRKAMARDAGCPKVDGVGYDVCDPVWRTSAGG